MRFFYPSKICLVLCCLTVGLALQAQEKSPLWTAIDKSEASTAKTLFKETKPRDYRLFTLRVNELKNTLVKAPQRGAKKGSKKMVLQFPNERGVLERFEVVEASVMAPELQAKYPSIRSYAGKGLDHPGASIRFSVSPLGFKGMVRRPGAATTIIEPYTKEATQYIVFDKGDRTDLKTFECLVEDAVQQKKTSSSYSLKNADDGILRTYRLAMSADGEYTQYFGGTKEAALAAINATMTRVNGVFEIDFNTTMVLIANTDDVIYTDPNTDPYGGSPNSELQATLTAEIGEENYDIGHLVQQGADAGNAGCIGCVCVDGQKGSGITSFSSPEGDNFDIDFVAHEMGHQFGANHTFTQGSEGGTGTQMEPGSGSTIMGYAGITGATDVQDHSDPYFHAASIKQVTDYIKTTTCQTDTATGNNTPTADAGSDYTIPGGTPFVLTGDGTDADGDNLTFCWEQFDENNAAHTFPSPTETSGVAFRSFPPIVEKYRYFPKMETVLTGNTTSQWEAVPTVSRDLTFRLTVRDNVAGGGQNNSDDMIVSVDGASGPFVVSSQASAENWDAGTAQTITWDVAGTDSAPVNCATVSILFSTDGGNTFPITLASNIANNGSYDVIAPNETTTNGRIKIVADDNIFYTLNTSDIAVQASEFIMSFDQYSLAACAPTSVDYTFTYNTFLGFDEEAAFTASGNPDGTTVSFNPATATTDGTTVTMTLSGIETSMVGSHQIDVTGTSTTINKTTAVNLQVYSSNIATPVLNAPADGAVDLLSNDVLLSWEADVNVVTYTIDIATDSGFASIVESTTTGSNTYQPTALVANTSYYWRVKGTNNCGGDSGYTGVYAFTTANITCDSVSAINTPVAIPDGAGNNQAGSPLNSTITFPVNKTISDVNVTVNVTHSYVEDLVISLIAPDETRIVLFDRQCGSNDNISITYDDEAGASISCETPVTGTATPANALSGFDGKESAGTWTLEVVDYYNADAGTLESWSLDICGIPLPDFTMDFDSDTAQACLPGDATHTFTYHTYAGFGETTTFSAIGNPAGSTVSFDPSTANADGTSVTMTVSGLDSGMTGNHAMTVTGSSESLTKEHVLDLAVYNTSLSAPTLTAPADGITGFLLPYTLSWTENVSAANYTIEIATDNSFTNTVETGSPTTNSYLATLLEANTTYYWRVKVLGICGGNSDYSTVFSFTTANTTCDVGTASDTPFDVPDNNPQGISSTINIAENKNVIDVNVTVNISYIAWAGDLTLVLRNPQGISVELSSNNGSSGANYTNTVFDDSADDSITEGSAPFTGSFRPEGNLTDFNGTNSIGDWTLIVVDSGAGDTGTLDSWSIEICGTPFVDDDGDGIANENDICPNTPAGEAVNPNGCAESQLDDDGDGIMNNVDDCPNTPTGENVNDNGCAESQLDDDGDGVMNDMDLCPNTPAGSSVNTSGCLTLPVDNFNITVIGESCPDQNNGQIEISAVASHNYVVTVNGTDYSLTNNALTLENMAPGVYTICFTIPAQNYEQCHTTNITESNSVTGKTSVQDGHIAVEIQAGTAPYSVFVNQNKVLETSSKSFSVKANQGDIVEISSDISCEGSLTKIVAVTDLVRYPNPTEGMLTLELPVDADINNVTISLYNVHGQLISAREYEVNNGKAYISLEGQPAGMYLATVHLELPVSIKIQKQ